MPTSIESPEVEAVLSEARASQVRTVGVDGAQVPITVPYPSPADWRDQWIYFAMVDRFNNPNGGPATSWNAPFDRFQGGTLEDLRRQLAYLQRLGVGAIWITPVLQNCQGHDTTYYGYGIQHFLRVDPRFASDQAGPDAELRCRVDEAHARGMYVILDVILNYAGDVFAYDDGSPGGASSMPWSNTVYPIRWRAADDAAVQG
jgi:glycosidase